MTLGLCDSPVGKEGRDDGDAVGGREPEGVDEEEELHEAVVGALATARLHHVHVLPRLQR